MALEVVSLIHGEAAGTAAEAVALGAEFTAVAVFAVKLAVVLGAVCRVEELAAQTCEHGDRLGPEARSSVGVCVHSFLFGSMLYIYIFFFFSRKRYDGNRGFVGAEKY